MVLVWRYAPAVGGVEKYVRALATELVSMGHHVRIVTGAHRPGLPVREQLDGIEILRFPAYRSRLRCWWTLLRWRHIFAEADVVQISDIMMLETYHAMIGWMSRPRPIFLTRHGLSCRHPVPPRDKRRALRAAGLVAGTVDDGHFIGKWLGVPGDVVLDQGLHPRADDIEQIPAPAPDSAVFVGRLEWDSGLATYLDALRILKLEHGVNLRLDVYGGGSLEESLRRRVAQEELPVTFHGFVENAHDRLFDAYFAFVSGRLAIKEAMARRRLVVATYVNPIRRDYLSDEPFSPHLLVGGSGEELAEIVAHHVRNPAECRRRVDDAFAYARTLSWNRTARSYLQLWQSRSAPIPVGAHVGPALGSFGK